MSHVRRKPDRHPRSVIRKKKTKTPWLAYFILLLLFAGVIFGIIMVIISTP